MQGWRTFTDDMQQCYGVDMTCLNSHFQDEQRQYYLATSAWADVHPSQLQGPAACIRTYDLGTLTQQELEAPLQVLHLLCSMVLAAGICTKPTIGCSSRCRVLQAARAPAPLGPLMQQRHQPLLLQGSTLSACACCKVEAVLAPSQLHSSPPA